MKTIILSLILVWLVVLSFFVFDAVSENAMQRGVFEAQGRFNEKITNILIRNKEE